MNDATNQAGTYRVLARKYRPATFADLIGQDAMVRTVSNAFEAGRIPQAWILTGVRGVGKTTTARILARALNYELPDGSITGADHRHAGARRPLPGDHGKPASRRDRDGRRFAQWRRRRARRSMTPSATRRCQRPLQGLHPRRSAHAVWRRLQCAAQDTGRAAAARQIRVRHHRNPQGADHRAVALPALRSAPGRCRRCWSSICKGSPARRRSPPSRKRWR